MSQSILRAVVDPLLESISTAVSPPPDPSSARTSRDYETVTLTLPSLNEGAWLKQVASQAPRATANAFRIWLVRFLESSGSDSKRYLPSSMDSYVNSLSEALESGNTVDIPIEVQGILLRNLRQAARVQRVGLMLLLSALAAEFERAHEASFVLE